MSKGFNWIHFAVAISISVVSAYGLSGSTIPAAQLPAIEFPAAIDLPPEQPLEVAFMRKFIDRVNPAISVEDAHCAQNLPLAIHSASNEHGISWQTLFVLAWQESDFDCHAKSRRDKGGAYGPYQIRRLWEPVVGDPRENYFDPILATDRATKVLRYYMNTSRFENLIRRRFVNPLLCLYNTGESRRVNMRYCQNVGGKLRVLKKSWAEFAGDNLVAMEG